MSWPEDRPAPNTPAPSPSVRPPRLGLLTVPLLIGVIYNAISLLTLPFSGPVLNDLIAQMERTMGQGVRTLGPEQVTLVLWLSFALTAALVLWLYFTRRAVLEGRAWGRVSSIVIAVFSLLLFPVGTVLGIIMLVGAFDRDVTRFLRR